LFQRGTGKTSEKKAPAREGAQHKAPDASPRETTQYTGFGLAHTYELLRNGTMPAIRVGKQFFIPENALLQSLDSCGQKPL
jgi:excisionase family DNA binding protein